VTTGDSNARVVIADDQAVLRRGMQAVLATAPGLECVGEAESGPAALREVGRLAPDLLLIDLFANGVSTLATISEIAWRHPATKVAVYTAQTSREDVISALRAGASAYLLKTVEIDEMVGGVGATLRGQIYLSPAILGHVVDAYLGGGPTDLGAGSSSLSPRERAVLKLVASGQTSKQIGRSLVISPRTVEKHRARMMRKLGLHTMAALMAFAFANGYVEEADAEAPLQPTPMLLSHQPDYLDGQLRVTSHVYSLPRLVHGGGAELRTPLGGSRPALRRTA